MSYDDDHRGNPNAGRERGAYTPPTDDDLPFERRSYDPRRAPAAKSPPVTLIISAIVLLLLIVAVVVFYRSGVRSSTDAPPAVGTPASGSMGWASSGASTFMLSTGVPTAGGASVEERTPER